MFIFLNRCARLKNADCCILATEWDEFQKTHARRLQQTYVPTHTSRREKNLQRERIQQKTQIRSHKTRTVNNQERKQENMEKCWLLVKSASARAPIWIIFGSYIEPRVGHMCAHAHRKPENLEKPSPLSGKSLTV